VNKKFEIAIKYLYNEEYQKSLELFIESANENYFLSYFYIFLLKYGSLMRANNYIVKDKKEIDKYSILIKSNEVKLKNSVDNKEKYSFYVVSKFYYEGILFKKNKELSLEYVKKGVEKECPLCINFLAIELEEIDFQKSIKLFNQAYSLGLKSTLINLAYYYLEERYNKEEFLKLVEKGKEIGLPSYFYALALYYEDKDDKYKSKNPEMSFKYMEKAAELGNLFALEKLASFYDNGFGTELNLILAFNMAEKLAEIGTEEGLELVGNMYKEGFNIPKNMDISNEYFKLADEKFGESSLIYLVHGDDKNKAAWYYIKVKRNLRKEFLKNMHKNTINLDDFGNVIESGFGEDPPSNITEKLKLKYEIQMMNFDNIKEKNDYQSKADEKNTSTFFNKIIFNNEVINNLIKIDLIENELIKTNKPQIATEKLKDFPRNEKNDKTNKKNTKSCCLIL